MGRAKNAQIEWDERGYGPVDGLAVCPNHLYDSYLVDRVREAADQACSYCSVGLGAPLEMIMHHVIAAIRHYYHPALTHLAWEGMAPAWDGEEVLDDVAGDDFDPAVRADIAEALCYDDHRWTPYDEHAYPGDGWLGAGWERFRDWVKGKSRFLLEPAPANDSEEGEAPQNMLEAIGTLLLSEGRLHTLPAGTCVFRARTVREETEIRHAHQLSAPPARATPAGRMNPRGIPIFYGATDRETAAIEAYSGYRLAVVAEFQTLRDLEVIDLSWFPPLPTLYDESQRQRRDRLQFLASFAWDVARPIDRDGNEELEYLPSQAITEYLRLALPSVVGTPVHGLMFRSSRAGRTSSPYPTEPTEGGINIALFVGSHGGLSDDQLPRPQDSSMVVRLEEQVLALRADRIQICSYGPPSVTVQRPLSL